MNDILQSKLSQLEQMISIQDNSLVNEYMYGLANGMILAYSVFDGNSPKFRYCPKEKINKLRHKCIHKRIR